MHAGDGREMRRHRALLDAVKICLPRHHHEHLLDFSLTCDESARLIFINTLFSSPALHSAMAMATILLFPAACGQSISRARLRNPSGRVGTVPRDPRRRGCGGLGGTDLCVLADGGSGMEMGPTAAAGPLMDVSVMLDGDRYELVRYIEAGNLGVAHRMR